MKKLFVLMSVTELTGDSTVKFFTTKEARDVAFFNIVQPLREICWAESMEEDEQYFEEFNEATGELTGIRFNTGENDVLDEALPFQDVNNYFERRDIEVNNNITHYVAQFSQHVDESTIQFFTQEQAEQEYEAHVNALLNIAKDHYSKTINRNKPSTWTDESIGTMFDEDKDAKIAYFGLGDPTETVAMGEILIYRQTTKQMK